MNARFSVWCTINRVRSDEVRACVYMYVSVYTCICFKGNRVTQKSKKKKRIRRFLDREKVKERHIENSERLEYIKFTCSSAGSPRFVSSELVKLACLHKYGSPVNQRFFQHFTYLFYLLAESNHKNNHLIFIKHSIIQNNWENWTIEDIFTNRCHF